ncbi:DUF2971 domain-containing protein [Sphingomonas sinipercae]|uniref:DUF2971 domain-containing protein n=1 Tax=Sphingomonas sinipercae TaxID=2714944 RepID=A0A6G7ZNZ1_9SPHN|nr:DUF2971 domain-containing protein [Sphingomonas sinipercae]QIL02691.1 DUF2971 domain-containing protein [Sphingomonas sinipercae]
MAEIERRRPSPPAELFKYVVSDRIDVLENALIRFSPPLNTNDIFEVRQTFDLIMGPKMQLLFEEAAAEADVDGGISDALRESPLSALNVDQAKQMMSAVTGANVEHLMRRLLGDFIAQMPAQMNAPENIDRLIDRVAGKQLLLSLSEKSDSSPMWAHYAGNSSGFVIAFDTSSDFFRRGENYELQGLHKVAYFDGRVPEIMDNPYGALISKQADWSYEREWRLYAKVEDASVITKVQHEQIHLVPFPHAAVRRVILGSRASDELKCSIKSLIERGYPGVHLTRATPDRRSATLIELPVED